MDLRSEAVHLTLSRCGSSVAGGAPALRFGCHPVVSALRRHWPIGDSTTDLPVGSAVMNGSVHWRGAERCVDASIMRDGAAYADLGSGAFLYGLQLLAVSRGERRRNRLARTLNNAGDGAGC